MHHNVVYQTAMMPLSLKAVPLLETEGVMAVSILSFISTPELLQILGIALCAGIIGWATNWLAIQLTFYPVEFRGLGRWIGWQGIIPSKAEKMAGIVVERCLSRLGDLNDVFQRMEPEVITRQIIDKINPRIEEIIDEIMDERQPVLWNNLPEVVRRRTYEWARQQLPRRVEALMADFADQIGDLVDLKHLVVEELKKDRSLMNRIFQRSGDKEFRFIIRSGFWFGAILGVAQAFLWLELQNIWLLIAGGFLIGAITNWIALNIIFRPVEPRLVLGVRLQGLFLQRQQEVARVWSNIVATELLTVERVANAMINGPYGYRTRAIIHRHIQPALDKAGIFKVMTQVAVGASGYAELKEALESKAIEVSTTPFRDPNFNQNRADVVAELIYERMAALPPAEFQDVLRPAFQEEEWQLILIGGVLGSAVGWLQYLTWLTAA